MIDTDDTTTATEQILTRSLFLLADSELLFWSDDSGSFVSKIVQAAVKPKPSVAYIGASNGDMPEAFQILQAALDQAEVGEVQHVTAAFPDSDRAFLDTADIIVLSGGDVEVGWNVFAKTGMREVIERRYLEGVVLVGVSAGAVQFGKNAALEDENGGSRLIDTFGFVNIIVDVHDEKNEWRSLAATIHLLEGSATGIGIPKGGGLIVHSDSTIEPIRRTAEEFTYRESKLRHAVLSSPVAN
ncbi:MAG TPA: Type 1 glutamine amidotransferase-like domain-containing protein [Steroidobacteraceae bacterium]|jgi:cyanophycinase-like exopeptidase